ncbi:MAG: bifunctional phosphopantothenoylcysteine decarboxylase/phosphopantothenate--cysteine ligase CoaBC [Schleiferiaceae bacterium]|nr:bifunctional phosphopantothenoylcysteine decarboxylase/phosphopantothenate--cysteine ligase CoaBC [Schleiferiaceae bacterium]MDO7648378.1 bifunctional phosphopantothenoylcysteine decarboxylase/phosphopantothenate--cysteine ligase CoaBC [Schleiferiaceae bacterium]MDO7661720.1 bifunctional phosphopantothenoylcysteine decarboxylase/phosphopantothenate--cysteine ligase CoaBC [Schleiferiaceae bacterium]MDO7686388.1 bifunctional phosphopantothenoylcysteine decarboxylase/phosphopantothenate--cystein
MSTLKGKQILVGISGGIAAYKIPSFIRELRREGAEVRCVLTHAAKTFVSPLTLATLSGQPAQMDFVNEAVGSIEWNNHVAHAEWADAIVVAPATSNSIAKICHGLCDNLLTAVLLSAKCPIFWAPAMDLDMFIHPANQKNLSILTSWGHHVWPSPSGELASGLTGPGRMAEPVWMLQALKMGLSDNAWEGKTLLMTSGPTVEAIDPVRFISNGSSGRMGTAIALAAANRGARVELVSGPAAVMPPLHSGIHVHAVLSAEDMLVKCNQLQAGADVVVCAAAVSDYRPAKLANEKMPKGSSLRVDMLANPDILQHMGTVRKDKHPHQIVVGFALETHDAEAKAKAKRLRKQADLMVLNHAGISGEGMHAKSNRITLLDDHGQHPRPQESKADAAEAILDWVENHWT